MKYICFNRPAVENIILHRDIFSTEFQQGQELIRSLRASELPKVSTSNIYFSKEPNGLFFVGEQGAGDANILVIDLEQSKLLGGRLSDQEILQILQKTLRFAVRYWNGLGFPDSERILTESQKAVLFPFPFSVSRLSAPFKILIEREADNKRLKERGFAKTLLLYKANYEAAPSYPEQVTLGSLRAAVESWRGVHAQSVAFFASKKQASSETVTPINIVDLGQFRPENAYRQDCDQWLQRLSLPQMKVINSDIATPTRIQGAAGTGKTLTLMLKAIVEMRKAKAQSMPLKSVFITHSSATRDAIKNELTIIDNDVFNYREQSLDVKTLYEIFLDILHSDVSLDEIVEREAEDAKLMQEMYIEQCCNDHLDILLKTFPTISSGLRSFFYNTDRYVLIKILSHEFSVQIKGKAAGYFDSYKRIPSLSTGIPALTEIDKHLIYRLFSEYQSIFDKTRQFDADDIAISVFSKLNTPIWRRRRIVEGYDYILMDETHLFNLNELQTIHFLSKHTESIPLIFSIDSAQAIGELAWDEDEITNEIGGKRSIADHKMQTVFRSTSEIVKLSASILMSGSQIFSNIIAKYNELSFVESSDDIRSGEDRTPRYVLCDSDQTIVERSIKISDEYLKRGIKRSDICLICYSDEMLVLLRFYLAEQQIPFIEILKRGDINTRRKASSENKYIIARPEYVGGLEFESVALLGVDKGRVPGIGNDVSELYFIYLAINKLYVSVSRARKHVTIWGDINRGISPCLEYAVNNKFLKIE